VGAAIVASGASQRDGLAALGVTDAMLSDDRECSGWAGDVGCAFGFASFDAIRMHWSAKEADRLGPPTIARTAKPGITRAN